MQNTTGPTVASYDAIAKTFADRWFDLRLGYRYEERESELPTLDYDQNLFFIEANLSL